MEASRGGGEGEGVGYGEINSVRARRRKPNDIVESSKIVYLLPLTLSLSLRSQSSGSRSAGPFRDLLTKQLVHRLYNSPEHSATRSLLKYKTTAKKQQHC